MAASTLAVGADLPVPVMPAAGCQASAAELEKNRQVVIKFFNPSTTPAQQLELVAPSYKQHAPMMVKQAAAQKKSDYDLFKEFLLTPGRPNSPPAQPGKPNWSPFEMVAAQCDLVVIMHKMYLQDPTAPEGTYYENFRFDAFRVTSGKITEHWDGGTLDAPRPAAK